MEMNKKRGINSVLLLIILVFICSVSCIYAEDSECNHKWYCSWNTTYVDDNYHNLEWCCSECEAKKYEKREHNWNNEEYIYKDNYMHTLWHCSCGATKLEHHWDTDQWISIDNDYHQCIHTCGCGETEVLYSEKHEWGAWDAYVDPTVFKNGSYSQKCVWCNAVKKTDIPKVNAFAKFTKKTYSVAKNNSINMKNYVRTGYGDSVKTWKVNKKSIATISKAGKLKAKKIGTVKVTVTLKSGKKATCTVKVTKPKVLKVYWTPRGSVYHKSKDCPTLARSKTIKTGTIKQSRKKRCCKVCG